MQNIKAKRQTARGPLLTALVFLLMLAALWYGLSQVRSRSDREQAESLRDAARRAAVLCYAVEGRYPASVEELCQHYGLAYDEDRYIISISSFASNLMPDIEVLVIGGGKLE